MMDRQNRMVQYELEKRKLQALELPPEEYENAIKELAERLGV